MKRKNLHRATSVLDVAGLGLVAAGLYAASTALGLIAIGAALLLISARVTRSNK